MGEKTLGQMLQETNSVEELEEVLMRERGHLLSSTEPKKTSAPSSNE